VLEGAEGRLIDEIGISEVAKVVYFLSLGVVISFIVVDFLF